ncbi:cilia- and flagella-associated protein 263 [Patagioenas fasciata]|uniref:cilia- and flagella-associated protein 263 n=1 Tax=Patagioenas fasciata TaxID=372321 RepID=UPI0032E8DE98
MAERALVSLPLPQLRAQLQEARHTNDLLQIEVEMFEKWHRKMDPREPSLRQLPEAPSAPAELSQTRGRHKSRLYSASDSVVSLTVEQKCELAERELADVKDEIQRMKEDTEQALKNLEAVIEEADVWRTDVKQAIIDFEKDIFGTTVGKKGRVLDAEKLLRYMEEKNRQRDLLKEKFHLKNYLLKGFKKKLQQQLRQKQQMGDTLREVHMQQLQVRSAQYHEKIEEKNEDLLQLKLTAVKTVQVLNSCKKKLQDAMATSTSLKKDISQRKVLLGKVEREAALVEEQRAEAESMNRQLQKQLLDYDVPSVMSYVQKKMSVTDLEKSIKTWQRKVAVAEMSLQRYRRAWNQVKMSGNQC